MASVPPEVHANPVYVKPGRSDLDADEPHGLHGIHDHHGYKVPALDIYRAAQLGDLNRCQKLVEENGPQLLLEHDERGHTALHWACLAGHNEIVRYFIQCNAALDKGSLTELAPKPIHWACVNGHIITVDLLLQHGVSINTTDNRGCTPLIIATQYGKTTLVGYLIGKGARKDFTDIDGDTALHWAAFKGLPELVQLLLYSGFNPKQKDDVGQTPLHLACLSGNISCVRLMCKQPGIDVTLQDNNGKTPLDLAKKRSYNDIVTYLEMSLKVRSYCGFCKKMVSIFGENRRYMFFYMFCLLGVSYPLYIYHFSFLVEKYSTLNGLFLLLNVPMWILFLRASRSDPGYLSQNTDEYDLALKQVSLHKEWETSADNPLTRLCHSCRLLRPQRSKHCATCDRCVDEFDHHCDFINNCVGPKNRVLFVCYFFVTMVASYLAMYMAYQIVAEYGLSFLRFVFLCIYGIYAPIFNYVLVVMIWQIARNVTANERLNMPRYEYLRDASGRFQNPYDRGVIKNCMEFFHLIPRQKLGSPGKDGIVMSV